LPIRGPALKLMQLLADGAEWPGGISRPAVEGGGDGETEKKEKAR